MDSKQLTQELVKDGLLSESDAQKVLRDSSLRGVNVDEIIYERRLVDDKLLAKVKSRILGVPYKEVNVEDVPDEVTKVVPEETVINYKVIPISRSDGLLTAGMVHPDDPKAQEALKFIAKQMRLNLGVYLVSFSDWEMTLKRYSPYKNEIAAAVKSLNLNSKGYSSLQRVVRLEEGGVADEAPIIKIVSETLKEAVFEKASDIHIEPQRSSLRIRFRREGDLQSMTFLPLELQQPIVSRVKVLANLKLDETRIPQDGRFRTVLFGRDIDFRVASFPTAVGEKVAIRVLDPTVGLMGLDALGLYEENIEIVKAGIERPYGMILITGPTGSGKTTTLYAIMQILNTEDVNIVSLEDPVEYFIEGVNQSQVKPEIGYDFASGLREIVRQDPDIIMVGEIRDEETAALTVHAALTGHIVLSTLHTNNSLGVIPRLIDMKVEPFLLPSSLNLMMAQRLVGRLCDKCRKSEMAPPAMQNLIKKELSKLPKGVSDSLKRKFSEPYKIYHSSGCEACRRKGIIGRVALFEAFLMTPELERIIESGPTEDRLLGEARRQEMISLRGDGIIKVLGGDVSLEEVLRETVEI